MPFDTPSGGGGEPNVPDWTEDANSPLTGSGGQAHTFTLNGTFDEIMIRVSEFTNTSGGGQAMDFRVNGDSTSNYDYVNVKGTTTVTDTKWPLNNDTSFNDGNVIRGTIWLSGRWSDGPSLGFVGSSPFFQQIIDSGQHRSIASPLDSVTFRGRSGQTSVTAEVYGRDIA